MHDVIKMLLLAVVAAAIQLAAGLLPGKGTYLMLLGTLPILLGCTMLGIRYGVMTYLLTLPILYMLQPQAALVFHFAIGLLGLVVGCGLVYRQHPWSVSISGGLCLMAGIVILTFGADVPVPMQVNEQGFGQWWMLVLLAGCVGYSGVWTWIGYVWSRQRGM
ncbi:hypothetical protein [Brevibacillus dissolubilis]|uniref:hypothetical protein n=1 Tax=Brevibacillus dissolubilis TaxID=1844116 RepID=UPI001117A7E1|nr:hypothetical protein [Brevibacillus dissolubilis]